MKIITFNLAGYKDWNNREAAVIDMIDAEAADLVLLQEAKFDPKMSGFSQASHMNGSLQEPYEYVVADITKFYRPSHGEPFREGLAVLSRFAITKSETLVLNQAEDDKHPRIAQLVDLIVGDEVLKIANVHFSNNKYSVAQLAELLQILGSRGEQRIMAGDFNILTVEQVKEATGESYQLAFNHHPYKSFVAENLTLDHMLIPHGWVFESVKAIDGLSDHSAVICEIKEAQS